MKISMSTVAVTIACFILYWLAYRFYAQRMARTVFQLDPKAVTPAYRLQDGFDYVPSRRYVLFGHHFASIAGLSPMLGPAIAVIWGWVPALFWVVFGTIFIGAVHDFSALVLSMRSDGQSIGKITESVIGGRAKGLFHILIFFLIALAMGVFVQIVAQLFSADFYPETVVPSVSLMVLAVGMGILFYKRGLPLVPLTVAAFVLSLGAVGLGLVLPAPDLPPDAWSAMMMVYAFVASILPVWLLLQPRDYLNSLLLYLGLISLFGGFFLLRPEFVAPAVDLYPPGAPPLFPFVFIVLACGAISGFHALVSSGTTAKQISCETDAPFIGYGAMIGESLLGLIAVMACTAGFLNTEAWQAHYASWNVAQGLGQSLSAFIDGSALFLGQLGVPATVGKAFIALVAVSFALTTLDSATRLLRYNIQEVSETLGMPVLSNRYLSSLLSVAAIGAFAFLKIDGQPAGLALWALFGTTNQLLGGLTLITVTLYLVLEKKNCLYTFVPMVFMVVTTVAAMSWSVLAFYREGQTLLLLLGIALLLLAAWVVVEGMLRFARLRTKPAG